MLKYPGLAAALLLATAPAAIAAQQADPQNDTEEETASGGGEPVDEIVVTANRERGAVIGDIPPEEQLDAGDIRSYGAASVSELLDALSPQTSSGRGRSSGRPVVLLNGQRISGFSEIRDLPTEAIERVDILPEEVALKYGYRADQRVVNFVLREHFKAYTADLDEKVPTGGGSNNFEAEADYVAIDGDQRLNIDLEAERTSKLLESERDIVAAETDSPYDLFGNVVGADGGEIDPALSAQAGQPVTQAGVPAGNTRPSLGDFAATAGATNVTDTTRYRTLQPSSQRYSLNAILARPLGDMSATGNIRLEQENTQALQGLAGFALDLPAANPFSPFANDVTLYRYARPADPLDRKSESFTGHGGVTLNGQFSGWQWSATGNYDRAVTETRTDRGVDTTALQAALTAGDPGANPFDLLAPPVLTDRARSVSSTGSIDTLINGSPLSLPAGEVSTSLKTEFETSDLKSESTTGGIFQSRRIGRDRANAQLNVDVPIARESRGVLSALGNLSINGNAQVAELSDFGTLTSLGGGFHWEPVDPVRMTVSYTQEEGAPSASQLNNPVISTPNTRIFDYVTGQTVDVTAISGGNAGLSADNRHVLKVGLDWKPLEGDQDLRISTEYIRERIDDPIASFPSATAEIEAAFPDRFVRDSSGMLVQVDRRPVNFQQSRRQQLRWGIDFRKRLQAETPQQPPQAQGERKNGDGGQQAGNGSDGGEQRSGRRGGRGGGGRHGRRGGRLDFSVFHTIHLEDKIFIRDGVAPLDLLNGSATGDNGGQPRHEIEARAGYFKNGLGLRAEASWQSATTVDGGVSGGDSLRFSDLATFDLRIFANLGEQRSLVRDHSWLRGTRVSLSVDNIFNARQEVTTPDGTVPLSYQPGYIDPLGRTIRISVRKLFF
ncbi:TonB-dependent receptor [Stakelama saccharophila]|uniref:TonB-dependent receptor n=1 Tax=Stakelama saccharophila TaxID=3075605 RepID=A0ABZ0BAG8_9SPHN|nr:TonB-dependent receptor [Stakelama sp. W311]WNO53666.1 TonB-dependent receptor [Stakelama sp. W311]